MYTYTIVYIYYIYSDPQYCNELDLGICSHQYEYDLTVRYATVYRLGPITHIRLSIFIIYIRILNIAINLVLYEPYSIMKH